MGELSTRLLLLAVLALTQTCPPLVNCDETQATTVSEPAPLSVSVGPTEAITSTNKSQETSASQRPAVLEAKQTSAESDSEELDNSIGARTTEMRPPQTGK